ncbi:MAG: NAD-dependent deacylase [Pseudomonas sp.]
MTTNEAAFANAVEWLANARKLMVFTGAGVSAESGIPTFRDQLTGFWAKFDPAQLATPSAFRNDPALVWGWYEWRRAQVAQARPNAAHVAIAALMQHVPDVVVVTQNVDDLHERAGSKDVIHLHGSLQAARCFACSRLHALAECPSSGINACALEPPRCTHCNGKIRPGVIWFGEELPKPELRAAFKYAQNTDLLLSIGTSGMVYPAARIPEIAVEHGARVVHINIEPVDTTGATTLTGRAGEWLPRLLCAAFGAGSGH